MKYNKIYLIILIVILSIATKYFQPILPSIFFKTHALFLLYFFFFSTTYIFTLLIQKSKIDKIVFYFFILMIFTPIYSAIMAKVIYNQPIIYGILSERSWLVIGVGFWLFYKIFKNKINIYTLNLAFLFLAFVSLCTFTIIYILIDPYTIPENEEFVKETINRGIRIKFQNFFITFGLLYFFIKYDSYKRYSNLLLFIVFLLFAILIIKSRTYLIFLILTIFIYFYLNNNTYKFLINLLKILIFILFLINILYIFFPEYISTMQLLFLEIFKALLHGESTDPSLNARIYEIITIWNQFSEHPYSVLFGTGKLSHQWNNGYESLFGYFYPSDIGFLGGLFLYGIFGMVFLMVIPIFLSIREIRKLNIKKLIKKNIFLSTIYFMLIFYTLKFVQNGLYFVDSRWIILFFILHAFNKSNELRKTYKI